MDYGDISPFEGQNFEDAINRLKQYPLLLKNFTDIISRHSRIVNSIKSIYSKKKLSSVLDKVHNYDDFQKMVTSDIFLNIIESSSIDEFSYSGISALEPDGAYLYISNHRDIILDCALLDLALFRSGRNLCEMAIGDNLLVNQFATDMFKVNGAITVKRDLSDTSDIRKETYKLSSYIRYCVTQKKKSVWIAQKSGRSKDGKDETSVSIIKMLHYSSKQEGLSLDNFLKEVRIVPVSVSYQLDPCDVSKGQQEIRKLKAEGCYNIYKKKKYSDMLDMIRGLRMNKGNVHISVGTPISGEIKSYQEIVKEVDFQIHRNYRLWDTNYFAYDYLEGGNRFASEYAFLNRKKFLSRYNGLDPEVVDNVLNSYANPVRSNLALSNPGV